MATGETLIEILKGLGVKDLHICEPLPKNHAANVELIRQAVDHHGLSVIVARRPCIHIKAKKTAVALPVSEA
jgi:indolepyruvate ferredoxin oxidoreductase alpha subunit